jgi:ankyrin repeat protein
MIFNNVYDKKIKELFLADPIEGGEVMSRENFSMVDFKSLTRDEIRFILDSSRENEGYTDVLNSILLVSAENGNTEIVVEVLKGGANINVQDNRAHTALMYASINGHTETANKLIENGANVNLQGGSKWDSALMYVAKNGYNKIVESLIEAGANVNLQAIDGSSALIYASKNGYVEIVEKLLKAGANVDFVSSESDGRYYKEVRKNALDLALENGHQEIANKLIKNGAKENNLNMQNFNTSLIDRVRNFFNVDKDIADNDDPKCGKKIPR